MASIFSRIGTLLPLNSAALDTPSSISTRRFMAMANCTVRVRWISGDRAAARPPGRNCLQEGAAALQVRQAKVDDLEVVVAVKEYQIAMRDPLLVAGEGTPSQAAGSTRGEALSARSPSTAQRSKKATEKSFL